MTLVMCARCSGRGVLFPVVPPDGLEQVSSRCPTCQGWGLAWGESAPTITHTVEWADEIPSEKLGG